MNIEEAGSSRFDTDMYCYLKNNCLPVSSWFDVRSVQCISVSFTYTGPVLKKNEVRTIYKVISYMLYIFSKDQTFKIVEKKAHTVLE